MNSRSFRSEKKTKFRHYILTMRLKNDYVEILRPNEKLDKEMAENDI